MKVVVYAICKNEASFVSRWMESMAEADAVVVLDTGSQDNTPELLREHGALVTQEEIIPWRFDTARNRSLALVPEDADICVCTDLDEVFRPGWRKALEASWQADTQQARYRYTWSFQSDGSEGVVFYGDKMHSRHGWQWVHPVHETLRPIDGNAPRRVIAEGVQLNHFPDDTKSRGQYLPLLELSVQEAPEDDRNAHYLGREYFFHGRWDDCIAALRRHLQMPTARWEDERAASMRYIAKAYTQKGDAKSAELWFLRAIAQAPHLREPYTDLAAFLYERGDWYGVLYFTALALRITERPNTYICEADAWGSLPHDLRAVALYHLGLYEESLAEAEQALLLSPTLERLQKNVALIAEKVKAEQSRSAAK